MEGPTPIRVCSNKNTTGFYRVTVAGMHRCADGQGGLAGVLKSARMIRLLQMTILS